MSHVCVCPPPFKAVKKLGPHSTYPKNSGPPNRQLPFRLCKNDSSLMWVWEQDTFIAKRLRKEQRGMLNGACRSHVFMGIWEQVTFISKSLDSEHRGILKGAGSTGPTFLWGCGSKTHSLVRSGCYQSIC